MRRIVAVMVVAMPPNRAITTGAAALTESLRGFLGAYEVDVKYLWLYHRNNGTWELARLMWNSSDPAVPAAAQSLPQPR
jgi:hypothetical protein